MDYETLITAYEADVQCPDVSGMEHLDMLLTRSKIAKAAPHLSDKLLQRVLEADKLLIKQARQFYDAIESIASLASWRHNELAPVTHWWWYLDVIAHLPTQWEISTAKPALQYVGEGQNTYHAGNDTPLEDM